jgi:hypothetical protein
MTRLTGSPRIGFGLACPAWETSTSGMAACRLASSITLLAIMPSATAKPPSGSVLAPVRGVFRAVVVTVVPEARQLDEPAWLALEALVEDALKFRPPAMRRQLQLFLRAIQWLPVVRYGRTFTALADPQRSRVLLHLENHPVERIRCGFWGLRTLALLGYYGRPEAAHSIGYRPDPRGWEAVQSR